jgi:hypothetical protein
MLAPVRTCPACGEDTKAGYAEACSECGFSPAGEDPAEPDQAVAEITVGELPPSGAAEPVPTAGEPPPSAGEPPPPDTPPIPAEGQPPPDVPASGRKRPARRLLVWLVVIGGLFAADALGVFDQPPGPDVDRVEQAIADDARQYGVVVTVDCPDDADQTEVDASFKCTATSASGETVTIRVINHEDSFEWQSGPLSTLS